MNLVSVVLSGGAGTRLWPVSRQGFPKPFMKLGGKTLLEQAVERGQACGSVQTLVVTNQDYLSHSLSLLGHQPEEPRIAYLLEPRGRNTAAAIALAALACEARHGPDTVMLVLPADHLVPDTRAFVANAIEAAHRAQTGELVVFGITPTGPETGFGYIEVGEISRESQKALRFVEKPDHDTAVQYLASGRYYWNSGMFCFTAAAILQALREHAPEVHDTALSTWRGASQRPGVSRFDAAAFALMPDISIDYAVMERARNVAVVPARFGWSDVGTWPAVARAHPSDSQGNTFDGDVIALDTTNTHVQVESLGPKIVATLGVHDLTIVDTPDALLVAHNGAAQDIRRVVDLLKSRDHPSTHTPHEVRRPWGRYANLNEQPGFKVKRIVVAPGQAISLQYHHKRSEHWVIVSGTAVVQIGDTQHKSQPGDYHFIPVGERHRLTNPGEVDLVMVEVQCGDLLDENDIVRLKDSYGRVE